MEDLGRKRPRLADGVVQEIAARILGGKYPVLSVLPGENQLCTEFNVSRTVVREASARLQRMGLVDVKHGLGTRVAPQSRWREFDPDLLGLRLSSGLIADLVPDLMHVRRMIEVEAAGLAAVNRTAEDLERLAASITLMDAAGDSPEQQTDADIAFHEDLLAASGIRLLAEMMRPINQLRRMASIMTTSSDPAIIPASVEGHQQIFAAIVAEDPVAAEAAMGAHIQRFERELLTELETFHPREQRAHRVG